MNIDIVISSIVVLILFGVFNGLIVKWAYAPVDERDFCRKWWHRCGMCLRIFVWFIVWNTTKDIFDTALIIILTAIEYNVSINLINGMKWWSVGTTSSTDKLIRKLFPFIKW